MNLTRGRVALRGLDGSTITQEVAIERETDKAVLIRINRGITTTSYWFPKSQLSFVGLKIGIPDWLWEKREVA